MASRDNITPLRGRACPVCGKRSGGEHAPFCSVRCKDVDLSRWLGGNYRIPTDERPPEGEPADDQPARDDSEL